MTANADDPVLRLLSEAGLEDDPALTALLGELAATTADEPPTPSRDVVRLMSGRRPARSSWFASRGTRTTTIVLLAAALAGGTSAAAAASPAFHTVVGDAFSSLAKLVGPPAHPKPASQDHGREPPKTGGGHQGPATGSGTAEAGDAPGGPVSPPSSTQKDAGEQKASSPEAANGEAAQTGRPAPGGEGSTTGESGTSSNRSTGEGGDQGESGASSTQKKAPARFQPAPSPGPSADSPPVTQDGSSGSGGQGTGR